MNCKKCNSFQTVTLRKKDNYCDECFMQSTNHKFRACLGKNKVLAPNENVLICLSGGPSSAVLLDLVCHGISLDNTKKLRIVPYFLHLFDNQHKDAAETVLELCSKYESKVFIVHLSNYMKSNIQLSDTNCIPHVSQSEIENFNKMLNSLPSTAANDFLSNVKRNRYIKCAKELKCNTVFTAEITNTLALNLLSNVALGRGSQVESDVGFSDTNDEKVKILRPMRDISKEELHYYIKIRKINPICDNTTQNHSLQSVISLFVEDLQENFQSTISTVCKTADKIGICTEEQTSNKCLICGRYNNTREPAEQHSGRKRSTTTRQERYIQLTARRQPMLTAREISLRLQNSSGVDSKINKKNNKLSALEATNFSRTVSLNEGKQVLIDNNDNTHSTMFPHIYKHLCYACSRNYSEMDQSKLPQHMQLLLAD